MQQLLLLPTLLHRLLPLLGRLLLHLDPLLPVKLQPCTRLQPNHPREDISQRHLPTTTFLPATLKSASSGQESSTQPNYSQDQRRHSSALLPLSNKKAEPVVRFIVPSDKRPFPPADLCAVFPTEVWHSILSYHNHLSIVRVSTVSKTLLYNSRSHLI